MGGLKLLLAGAAALLVIGLAACGDGDDSNSTTTTASKNGQTEDKSGNGGSAGKSKQDGKDQKSGSGDKKSSDSDEAKEASEFVPKQHSDAGGGSKQFRVKGGDNSVQEFGNEVGGSEFDEAASVLHNFLDARAESNWAASCEYMSKSMIESFEQLASQSKELREAGCAVILEKLTNPAAKQVLKEEAAQADVGSLRIEGEQAFLIYSGTEGTIFAMSMVNEGGAWKVGSLAGTPLN